MNNWRFKSIFTALPVLAALVFIIGLARRPHMMPSRQREANITNVVVRDGLSYLNDETAPYTGILLDLYPDGSRKSRSTLSRGRLHGISEGWYTNGILQVREEFENGVSHGRRTKWFPSGGVMSEAAIEHGGIVGMFRRWHENGTVAEEIEMKDNVPDGVSRAFYPSGGLMAEVRLERGRVVERQEWKEGAGPIAAAETK